MVMRLGIDLGGTKTEVAALDEAGEIVLRRRTPTPSADYDAIISNILELVRGAADEVGPPSSIGIAHPGAVSPVSGRIKNSNTTVLNDRPLAQDLARALDFPIAMANDADCFTLSEAQDGAAAGAPIVFGVIVGTGVGGGIVVRHELVRGPNAITGEWGHNPLPAMTDSERPGPGCYCGRFGCIETFLSGRGLANSYRELANEEVPATTVATRAEAGNELAIVAIETYCERLAKALAGVINVLDPHVIVLGGGLSNLDVLYRRVPELWTVHVLSDTVETKLVRAMHGDSSGVRGAAWLTEVTARPPGE